MSVDMAIYLIICIIALSICFVYLFLVDKHDKKRKTKNDLYFQELINKLDDIERSIYETKNQKK